jgi:hypothetical protein
MWLQRKINKRKEGSQREENQNRIGGRAGKQEKRKEEKEEMRP